MVVKMIDKLLKVVNVLVAISTVFLMTVCGMLVLTVLLCMWDLI